jgi:hypothetical protein
MTTHELLELAALDALGLLDDDEREAFDRAFRAAAPALQAQVRREQTRIARDESLLPPVDPPIGLKARVLAAWREAVEAMSLRGRRAGRFMPLLLPSRGVTPIWRAAAVGCAAASIVLGFATVMMKQQFNELQSAKRDNAIADDLRLKFGATFERNLFDTNVQKIAFVPLAQDAPDFRGDAVLFLDKTKQIGELYCRQMPADGREFRLVVMDNKGNIVRNSAGEPASVLSFTCPVDGGSYVHKRIENQVNLQPGYGLALIAIDPQSEKATPVLRSL